MFEQLFLDTPRGSAVSGCEETQNDLTCSHKWIIICQYITLTPHVYHKSKGHRRKAGTDTIPGRQSTFGGFHVSVWNPPKIIHN